MGRMVASPAYKLGSPPPSLCYVNNNKINNVSSMIKDVASQTGTSISIICPHSASSTDGSIPSVGRIPNPLAKKLTRRRPTLPRHLQILQSAALVLQKLLLNSERCHFTSEKNVLRRQSTGCFSNGLFWVYFGSASLARQVVVIKAEKHNPAYVLRILLLCTFDPVMRSKDITSCLAFFLATGLAFNCFSQSRCGEGEGATKYVVNFQR